MSYTTIESIITVLALGFMIGLQRSLTSMLKNEPFFMGSRTFALLALLGYLAAWIDTKEENFLLLSTLIVAIFLTITYLFKVTKLNKLGITTQLSAFLSFLMGIFVYEGWKSYAVFITVLTLVLLEIKPKLQQLEKRVSAQDINAVMLLLVMSFIVLPLLPNEMIGPYKLFNPYKTWVMAIIIATLSFIGYVAIKVFGQKHGVLITGAAGGLISSTAVSLTLAQIYPRKRELLPIYSAGIAISWTFMFFRVFVETLLINPSLAKLLAIPYLLTGVVGSLYLYRLYKNSPITNIQFRNVALEKNPLQLSEAIKFALLFGLIYGAIDFVEHRYGDVGVYIISVISGITDVDAITLSLSEMAKEQKLSSLPALIGIIVASYTNTLVKLAIVYWWGGRELGWSVMKFTLLVTLSLFGGLALVFIF